MSKGLSGNQRKILKWLGTHPTMVGTVERFQQIIGTSWPSIRRALYSLEQRGLIRRLGIGANHYQRWVKVGEQEDAHAT
jgi:DNA-binding MarR family transcriptional regulator